MQAEVNRLTKEKAVLEARERARAAAEVLLQTLCCAGLADLHSCSVGFAHLKNLSIQT